jgi:hypothetical protein
MREKRPGSESPVDPMMFRRDHSPNGTLTTTITSHKNDSKRSFRGILTRSRSSEQRLENERSAADQQNRILAMQAMCQNEDSSESLTPDPDSTWFQSELAPAPLRISNPPSEHNRPYSSDSTTHRAFHHPDHVVHPADRPEHSRRTSAGTNRSRSHSVQAEDYPPLERPTTSESYVSFSYPGRLKSDGIKRTESGGETYWPDGIENEEEKRKRSSRGSDRSMLARDAGRAY